MEYFVDTSIQVYRALDRDWFVSKKDLEIAPERPIVTDYVRREFRHTVVRAFENVIELVTMVLPNYGFHGNSFEVEAVIAGCLRELAGPSKFRSDRGVKIMIQILAHVLEQKRFFIEGNSAESFIIGIETWSEMVSESTFFVFNLPDRLFDVRPHNYREHLCCPLSREGHTCRREAFECSVRPVISGEPFLRVQAAINDNEPYYLKLKKKQIFTKLSSLNLRGNVSIGEKICFPLGDLYHASYCIEHGCILLSSDTDLCLLCGYLNIACRRYSVKEKQFTSM